MKNGTDISAECIWKHHASTTPSALEICGRIVTIKGSIIWPTAFELLSLIISICQEADSTRAAGPVFHNLLYRVPDLILLNHRGEVIGVIFWLPLHALVIIIKMVASHIYQSLYALRVQRYRVPNSNGYVDAKTQTSKSLPSVCACKSDYQFPSQSSFAFLEIVLVISWKLISILPT